MLRHANVLVLVGLLILPVPTALFAQPSPTGGNSTNKPKEAQLAEARAEDAAGLVQHREEQVKRLLGEFERLVRDLRPGDFAREAEVWEAARKLLPQLKVQAGWVLQNQTKFTESLGLLEAALKDSVGAYRQLSDLYQDFSTREEHEFFKQEYADWSQRARKIAEALEGRARSMDGLREKVASELKFVERSVPFLDRLQKFLAVNIAVSHNDENVQRYLKSLEQYLTTFQRSIGTLKTLTDKAIEAGNTPPEPAPSRTPTDKPAPNRPATPSRPVEKSTPSGSRRDGDGRRQGTVVAIYSNLAVINAADRTILPNSGTLMVWRGDIPIGEVIIHSRHGRHVYVHRGNCPVREWDTVTVSESASVSAWQARR